MKKQHDRQQPSLQRKPRPVAIPQGRALKGIKKTTASERRYECPVTNSFY